MTNIHDIDYNTSGPAFTHRKLDEGPVLNRIGKLCLLLHKLGLKSPAQEIFSGRAPKPKFHKKLRKEL